MKKTFKDCPVHGHGANGLGCYCKRKAPKWILDIIAEEKAKWKDSAWSKDEDGKKNVFGIGILAGIESIEFRVNDEGRSQ